MWTSQLWRQNTDDKPGAGFTTTSEMHCHKRHKYLFLPEWILNITEKIIGIPQNIVLVWQSGKVTIRQEITGYTD